MDGKNKNKGGTIMAHFSMLQLKKIEFEGKEYTVTVSGYPYILSVDGSYTHEPDSNDCPAWTDYEIDSFEFDLSAEDLELEDVERLDGGEVDEYIWGSEAFLETIADAICSDRGLEVDDLDDDDDLVDYLRESYEEDDYDYEED